MGKFGTVKFDAGPASGLYGSKRKVQSSNYPRRIVTCLNAVSVTNSKRLTTKLQRRIRENSKYLILNPDSNLVYEQEVASFVLSLRLSRASSRPSRRARRHVWPPRTLPRAFPVPFRPCRPSSAGRTLATPRLACRVAPHAPAPRSPQS